MARSRNLRALNSRPPGARIMETILNLLVWMLDVALLAFLAYGGYLVLGGGGFHRDAPEDAALPHLDVTGELNLDHR